MAIGIEKVEFGIVLAERRAGVGGAGTGVGFTGIIGFTGHERRDDAEQFVLVTREILQDFHTGTVVLHDRQQVRRTHLLFDERGGGVKRVQLVQNLHGAHVEIDGEEAAVLVLDGSGGLGGYLSSREFRESNRFGRACGLEFGCGNDVIEFFVIEELDGLRLVVFENGEVFLLQVLDGLAVFVLDVNLFEDESGAGAESGDAGGRLYLRLHAFRRSRRLGRLGGGQEGENQEDSE